MPLGELEYVFQFNRHYSQGKLKEAYEVYKSHPDLVIGLNKATLVAAVVEFRNMGMEEESKSLEMALSSRSGDEELKNVVAFAQWMIDVRDEVKGKPKRS